jgi:ABC-type nitrate/sulfonate/bicarbonate transport system substrate-binding protein
MIKNRGRRVYTLSWLGYLLAALALPNLSAADQSSLNEPTTSSELIISGSRWVTDAPTRIAAVSGYFQANMGPSIRVEQTNSGKQALERLMAGQADFALMASTPLAMTFVRLQNEGVPPESWPVILASVGLSSHTHHIIADTRHGIEQPSDLAGHTLGMLSNTSSHFGWDLFTRIHGIDPESVQLVNTPPDKLAAGLADGRFNVVVAWTPFSEAVMAQLGSNARVFPLQGLDTVSWLLVSRRSVIQEYPDVVDRVFQGYADAIALLQTEPDRAIALLDFSSDWLQDKRVAWKLALNWPVIANMEAKLEWSANQLGLPAIKLGPRQYIARDPLERFNPNLVTLPTWIPERPKEQ